ncbi:hypothetical protein E4U28_008100, partial [Claviceps purpurea]
MPNSSSKGRPSGESLGGEHDGDHSPLKIMMVPDHIVIPLLLTPQLSPPRSDPGDPRSSSPSPDPRHLRLLSPQQDP